RWREIVGVRFQVASLLDGDQSLIKAQDLGGMRKAVGQLRGALLAKGPWIGGLADGRFQHLHQTFSRFTRNDLNSGVYAFASPTNGVSKLAIQLTPLPGSLSADTPTKPQWMGIPTWKTFLPSIVLGPRRFVTRASTSIFPRFERTRTRSPLLMPFW